MLIFPVGLIGVYTSFSRESILDVPSIQKLAIQNGVKAVGISDPNYPFWVEQVGHLPKTSVVLFPAVRILVLLENQKIRLYIVPKSFSSLEVVGKKESFSVRDLKYIDGIVFYNGKNKQNFEYLYDILLGKLGICVSIYNKDFVEAVASKVDYIMPFHYSTIPQELEKYSGILRKFIHTPSPFPSAASILKDLENVSDNVVKKMVYTIERLKDIRDYEYLHTNKNEEFSSLLWNKIISSTNINDKIKKEFLKIKDLELSEFFYNLIISFEEFLKYGHITSDILSTSLIFEKLRLIKINKSKVVTLYYLLNEKPFYVDVDVSSKKKFKEILMKNFGDSIFYRVYPVHISEKVIDSEVKLVKSSVLRDCLKNVVYTFRISKNLFYSSKGMYKIVNRKDGINIGFCGKSYDAVLNVKHLLHLPSKGVYPKVLEVVKKDTSFITPYTVSPFWNNIRDKYGIRGINDTLNMFYIGKLLSYKPYYKSLVEELVIQGLPLFVENVFEFLDENTIEILLNIVWSRDKKDIAINEVDLFRMLIDNGVQRELAEKITRFVVKYKNVIGIKSVEVPKFYNFLSYAGLKIEKEVDFFSNILKDSVVRDRRYPFLVIQEIYKLGYDVRVDINFSYPSKVNVVNRTFYLPFSIVRCSNKFIKRVISERENKKFRSFPEFYARLGKEFPRDSNKLVKVGAFDDIDTREYLLKIPTSLPMFQKNIIIVSEEFRSLGFSSYLFKCDFSDVRLKSQSGALRKVVEGKINRVFGFVALVDGYGNVFIQDEKDVIFVKNKVFLGLKVGDYGVFELDSVDGIFGKSFFLKFFTKEL